MNYLLVGKPNVGKSSIYNILGESNKNIIHKEIGTTRDNVEMLFSLDGIKIKLIDTAGYMKTSRGVDHHERHYSVTKTRNRAQRFYCQCIP